MNLSKHFTLKEATESNTARNLGLKNEPGESELARMKNTAAKMEIVRRLLGDNPVKINSWFRGREVNRAVGGVPTSQHARGEAVDFTCAWFGTALEVALKLQENKKLLQYDQLIYEQTWVHISFVTGKEPRLKDLTFLGQGRYKGGIA